MQQLNKYKVIIFDYSDTLMSSDLNCPLISLETLQSLKSNNKKLAVFTAAKRVEVLDEINKNFPGTFDLIVTKDDVKNTKPDPEGLNLITNELNVLNSECLFIGDSENDRHAARLANVDFIEVTKLLKHIS